MNNEIELKDIKNRKWKRVWARRILMLLGGSFQRVFIKHPPLTVAKHKLYVPEGNLFAF